MAEGKEESKVTEKKRFDETTRTLPFYQGSCYFFKTATASLISRYDYGTRMDQRKSNVGNHHTAGDERSNSQSTRLNGYAIRIRNTMHFV